MQEGAAAAGLDVVAGAVLLLVARVVVLSALEVQQHLRAAGLDDLALEVLDIAVGMDLVLLAAAVDLLGHAQDDAVSGLHLVGGDIGEVLQLDFVDGRPRTGCRYPTATSRWGA